MCCPQAKREDGRLTSFGGLIIKCLVEKNRKRSSWSKKCVSRLHSFKNIKRGRVIYIYYTRAFGEGSIKLDIPRSSTVIALENSHFLYLSDAAFMQILDPFMSTALDRKIEYFKQS